MKENEVGKQAPDGPLAGLALEELGRVLESPSFRNSHQSQRLLRHLVERSLEGRFDDLRERVLGVELFGRPTGFDTNDDPIVRVRANEVRKRLARYYDGLAEPGPVRLELPTGAYRIEFRTANLPAPPPVAAAAVEIEVPVPEPEHNPVHESGNRWKIAAFCVGLAALLAAGAWFWSGESPILAFWAPVLKAPGHIIVCTGHPVVYRLSKDYNPPAADNFLGRQTAVRKLQPGEMVDAKYIIPIEDQYTGLGSAHAMARVSAWLATQGKAVDIRFGDDISFTDLKQSPAVLIGFANRWTINMTDQYRFIPELIDGRQSVRDRQTGKIWTLPNLKENGRTDEDYVLVARTFSSQSGQCMITVAGLTQYGTHSAGELISDPALLNQALSGAKPGWEQRNLQMLLHVRVVGHTPSKPTLLALHEW